MYRCITNNGNIPQYPLDNYYTSRSLAGGVEVSTLALTNNQNLARIAPVIARIDYVFSYYSVQDTNDTTKYDLYLKIHPIVVIWNSTNVAIDI